MPKTKVKNACYLIQYKDGTLDFRFYAPVADHYQAGSKCFKLSGTDVTVEMLCEWIGHGKPADCYELVWERKAS